MLSAIKFIIIIAFAYNVVAKEANKVIVKTVPIEFGELFDKFTAIGQCRNELSRSYYANSEGIVNYISEKEGERVNKGDLIITIDQKIAESTIEKASSNLKAVRLSYERNKKLSEKGYISSQAFEKIKVDYEEAKLNLQQANKQYEDLVIKAPFAGVVGVIKTRVGSKVNVGDYLFDLTANGDKTLITEVPENLYGKVNIDDNLFLKDSNNHQTSGKVVAVSKNLSSNGTLSVRVKVNKNDDFIDGSYLYAEFIINRHNGFYIPEATVLKNDKGNFIYLIDSENIVKQIYVELGIRLNETIEIISKEIKVGDKIVSEGLTKVSNGTIVEIQN